MELTIPPKRDFIALKNRLNIIMMVIEFK